MALPVQECCARNMKGNIQLPPMTGSERSWECQRRPPGRALKGLQLPGMGQAVAQDVPGCHQRGQEQGVGTPLTTGEQTAVSDSNHDQGGCTGAVSAHCPLPTVPSPQPPGPLSRTCAPPLGTAQFLGLPMVPSFSLGIEMIPVHTEQDPKHWEEGSDCRPPRDTAWGHQGQRMASTSPGI